MELPASSTRAGVDYGRAAARRANAVTSSCSARSSGGIPAARRASSAAAGEPIAPWALLADYPFAALILHINREAIHHGAEIALLRDLYAHRPEVAR